MPLMLRFMLVVLVISSPFLIKAQLQQRCWCYQWQDQQLSMTFGRFLWFALPWTQPQQQQQQQQQMPFFPAGAMQCNPDHTCIATPSTTYGGNVPICYRISLGPYRSAGFCSNQTFPKTNNPAAVNDEMFQLAVQFGLANQNQPQLGFTNSPQFCIPPQQFLQQTQQQYPQQQVQQQQPYYPQQPQAQQQQQQQPYAQQQQSWPYYGICACTTPFCNSDPNGSSGPIGNSLSLVLVLTLVLYNFSYLFL